MPTDEENVQYLYQVLTHGGTPTIDFGNVGKELDLKPGATSKRWSRLKKAMADKKNPGPTAYQFLWLCVKHSSRDKAMDWDGIAKLSNTTAGAASKRYSRLKASFESGAAAPSPVVDGKGKSAGGGENPATPTKRKRAPTASKAKSATNGVKEQDDKGISEAEDQEEDQNETTKPKPKRARPSWTAINVKQETKPLIDELEDAVKAAGGDVDHSNSEEHYHDAAEMLGDELESAEDCAQLTNEL